MLASLAVVGLLGWLLPAHAGVQASPALLRDNSYCLGCHAPGTHAAGLPKLDLGALSASVHRDLVCADCHTGVTAVPHRTVAPVNCGRCHGESVDRRLLRPDYHRPGDRHEHVKAHGTARPTCTSCHGTHEVLATARADSSVGAKRVADTCRTCHPQIAGEYADSVHGRAAAHGNRDVPTCATCHPEHADRARDSVQVKGVVATCTACHDDPGLAEKYQLPAHRLSTFLGSYHGAASELGDSRTANCASCHGVHSILPSSNPRSTIHRTHLATTCGRCHPGAKASFTTGTIHLRPTPRRDPILFFVKLAYQFIVLSMIGSFLAYISLDLLARRRKRFPPTYRPRPGEVEPEYERLSLNQRVQHWLLITSFSTLMITGLPLAAPHSPLSRGVVTFLGGMGARAVLHRTAALALVALLAYHLGYVLFTRRGHREFTHLLPGLLDAKDLVDMLRFYFGRSNERALFGRYNYIEKFEYLAVGWGSVVMITTGALLWNPGLSLMFVPKWIMDVAFIVHSWEALLAFLAIIIWHMYNVHFNPSVFPMSRVWLTGKISLHELKENHPLEYQQFLAEQAARAKRRARDLARAGEPRDESQ